MGVRPRASKARWRACAESNASTRAIAPMWCCKCSTTRDAGVHVRRVGGSGRVTPGNSRDNGCTAAARRGAHQQRGGEHAPKAIPPRSSLELCSPGLRVPALSASGISRGLSDGVIRRASACLICLSLSSIWLSTPLVPYRSSAVGLELYSGNTFRTLCSL